MFAISPEIADVLQEKKSVAMKKYDTVEPISNIMRALLISSKPILPTNISNDTRVDVSIVDIDKVDRVGGGA